MAEEHFSDLGRVEAIARLYEGTPYKPFQSSFFETSGKSYVTLKSRTFLEGIDFDLTYFPLKHLGYKCVTAVTGELYAEFSHPRTMEVRLGISSKLDFEHIKDVWNGIVTAAKEHGYTDIYRQSLIPMTEMQKLMGKSAFEDILGDLIYKPPGKPTLVPNTDKRPAMNVTNAENEFNEIVED